MRLLSKQKALGSSPRTHILLFHKNKHIRTVVLYNHYDIITVLIKIVDVISTYRLALITLKSLTAQGKTGLARPKGYWSEMLLRVHSHGVSV